MALWNPKQDMMPAPAPGAAPGRVPELSQPRNDDLHAPPPVPVSRREDVAPPPASSSDLLLGPGAEFDGKLTFRGTVRIDAKFTGSILTNDVLVVGEHARIDAEISCGTVIVHGEVNGNVRATTAIELRRGSKLRGDVTAPSLAVEKGALLQGTVKMTVAEKAAKPS
jgi:cytoskeletal protein CcmA (bactofilin family)